MSQARAGLEPGSPLPYLFSIPGNAAFAVVYLVLSLIHFGWFFRTRWAKWVLCLPISEAFSALGFALRIACRSNQQSIGLYAVANLFVILSPAAFLAFNYMLYGRLMRSIDPALTASSPLRQKCVYSVLPPKLVGRLFIWSDVITFLIQATGGGLQATGGDKADLGDKVFLIGVICQGISYLIFVGLLLTAHRNIARAPGSTTSRPSTKTATVTLYLLYLSSIFIIIRSVYRIIEMAQGYGGKLYSTENFLFFLDALPLALSNAIWAGFWPPARLANPERAAGDTPCDSAVYHRPSDAPYGYDPESPSKQPLALRMQPVQQTDAQRHSYEK